MAKQYSKQQIHIDNKYDWTVKQLYDSTTSDRFYGQLDHRQLEAYACLIGKQYNIIIFDEKAGCGKTTLAFLAGLNMLRTGKVAKIIYIRIPDERALRLGYVPGELNEKEAIFMFPAYDALLVNGLQPYAVDTLKSKGLIEFCTDTTMRGRNLENAYVIIDEPQNADLETLKLLLTRLHDNCKCVLSGHSGQVDSKLPKYGIQGYNAFKVYQAHLLQKPWAIKCVLPINYRGKVSRWADEVDETVKFL